MTWDISAPGFLSGDLRVRVGIVNVKLGVDALIPRTILDSLVYCSLCNNSKNMIFEFIDAFILQSSTIHMH